MSPDHQLMCAACGTAECSLKWCARCKATASCSTACQKGHWKLHKTTCTFTVTTYTSHQQTDDLLAKLRGSSGIPVMPVRSRDDSATHKPSSCHSVFNTAELRMSIFKLLPAKDLLNGQRVCRSWYRTISLETILQQRLFFVPGPSPLIMAATKDNAFQMAIQPRNDSQRGWVDMISKTSGPGPVHVLRLSDGTTIEKPCAKLREQGVQVILNPFFTKLWPQEPTNMTTSPFITVSTKEKAASWRRMQVTSPPTVQLDMSIWYTGPNGKGNQLRPSTGKISTGVTLGHLADLLASLPVKYTLHWVLIDGHNFWARSLDAVIVPDDADVGDNEPRPGVYVNPTNGIAMPGFI